MHLAFAKLAMKINVFFQLLLYHFLNGRKCQNQNTNKTNKYTFPPNERPCPGLTSSSGFPGSASSARIPPRLSISSCPRPMVVWWRECQGLQWKAPGGNPLRDEGESRRRGGERRRTATAVAAHSACVVAPPQCISPSTHAQARGFRAVGVDIECLGRIRVGEVIVAIAGFICR